PRARAARARARRRPWASHRPPTRGRHRRARRRPARAAGPPARASRALLPASGRAARARAPRGAPRPTRRRDPPPPCRARIPRAVPRIASLLPSTTEIACALGFQADLVGLSHECELPPGSGALPVLTEPKLDSSAPSRAIDERVRRLVRDGLSVYRVDAERLRAPPPDVILTQDRCRGR